MHSVTCMLSALESHHVENEWQNFSFPPPQFLFCFLVLSSKPSAHTQRLDGWIVHNCKNTQLFLDVIERRHLVQDWHGTTWNVNLHLHCWHIFLKVWAKSSGGRKPFIPEMPAAWRQFLFILKGLQERWKEASSFYLGADWLLGHTFPILQSFACFSSHGQMLSNIRKLACLSAAFYDIFLPSM